MYLIHDFTIIIMCSFFSSSSLWLKNVTPIPEVVKEKLQKFLQHEHLLNTELSDGDKGILKLMKKGTCRVTACSENLK